MKLSELENIISPLLSHFQAVYSQLTGSSSVPVLEDIDRHLQSKHGKQLRPLLMMLTAACSGFPMTAHADNPLFRVAAAVEALHGSSLMHDDVIDNSDLRRGIPTVNKQWGNRVAVLAGDFYLAQVMSTINAVDNKTVTAIVNQTVVDMCEGELMQQYYNGKFDISDTIYFDIIRRKTALFMASCCRLGAVLSSERKELAAAAARYGEALGMAFQIRDDIMDFLPATRTGKPQGNDIVERRCTLPLILAMPRLDATTTETVCHTLAQPDINDEGLDLIIRTVIDNDGIGQASIVLSHYVDLAINSLDDLPHNQFRNALADLALSLKEI